MKTSNQPKRNYKKALLYINKAFEQIALLEESLNLVGFGDNLPHVVVSNDIDEYGLILDWNDIAIDMEIVFEALGKYQEINPSILENLICNINE